MSDSRSASERYLSARRSSHLRLKLDARCEADTLLAAGFASRGNERKSAALAVYGVIASERMNGARALADVMAGWLRKKSYQARDREAPKAIERTTAIDLAMTVLKWWHHPACPNCNGLGHPLLLDSPVIDGTRECPACRGSGKIPLEKVVRQEHIELARWLSGEIEVMCAMVFGEIAHRLNADMDLAILPGG